jgi:hypothetical protein
MCNATNKLKGRLSAASETLYFTGAGARTRTADLLITNQLLYQLSYAGPRARLLYARRGSASTGKGNVECIK